MHRVGTKELMCFRKGKKWGTLTRSVQEVLRKMKSPEEVWRGENTIFVCMLGQELILLFMISLGLIANPGIQ